MSVLDDIRPTKQQRVIDLVRFAGIDVSDWENYKDGKGNPNANPKYCYEWAFVEPGKLIVLNLWHELMDERDGQAECRLNFQDENALTETHPARRARMQRVAKAVRMAQESALPIRVIVLSGHRRPPGQDTDPPSKVKARLLDPVSWGVVSVNNETGEVLIRRGAAPLQYVDQFSLPPPPDGALGTRKVHGTVRERSSEVRQYVLARAKGKCEFCGTLGFRLANGSMYLETHHVIPLSDHGPDGVTNVAALCPNHHREAHHGESANKIRERLLALLGAGPV